MLSWMMHSVGGAFLLAVPVTAGIVLIAGTVRNRMLRYEIGFLFSVTFFVLLTQYPFPNPNTLQCPVPLTQPKLLPFSFVSELSSIYEYRQSVLVVLTSKVAIATAMNFLLPFVSGVFLGFSGGSLIAAAAVGATVSFAVELTQLTGIWGIYPCAYRQFDVDDLIVNTFGFLLGAITISWMKR